MTRAIVLQTGDGRLATRAPAKVNLTLHVLGRRADGYHALESLVAFAGVSDDLTLRSGKGLSLALAGPRAGEIAAGDGNLVLRAALALAGEVPGLVLGAFTLLKRLPIAAGIGGGSADAAAALRLLAEVNGLARDDPRLVAAARATGADVPVCLAATARMMRGAGEELGPALTLPPLFAVLVNPGVVLETAMVFRGLGLAPGEERAGAAHPLVETKLPPPTFIAALAAGRNDLEAPALAAAPAIGEALALLREHSDCRLARMSGSGATVFGLFDDCRTASRAARHIAALRPAWWVKPTVLR
ncbi:4-(cytidine 5'-diphospho)-2-C-methyl-D-erythritol kinase [Chelatococcus sp. GCM10030263]|uniref:4-(cytidine 5'-diphospho)-2-C-methyl-D-erythritol kinase n=1 Tax=Chelatococcus sp. GCM10030263 TaxID=3273387 RepID=UPI00362047A6